MKIIKQQQRHLLNVAISFLGPVSLAKIAYVYMILFKAHCFCDSCSKGNCETVLALFKICLSQKKL